MNDNKRKLYDALSQDYDLGTFEQFESDIADAGKRRKLYDATIEEYDFGDFAEFENQLGFAPQAQSAPQAEAEPQQGFFTGVKAQIADTAKQAIQKPRGGENGYTFTAEELGIDERNGDVTPKVEQPQERAWWQTEVNAPKAESPYSVNPVEFQGQVDQEEKAIAARLPQANAAMSQRMQQGQTVQGAFDRAYSDYRVNYPAIEAEELTSGLLDEYSKERASRQSQVEKDVENYSSARKWALNPYNHGNDAYGEMRYRSGATKLRKADELGMMEEFAEDAKSRILSDEGLKAKAEENAKALDMPVERYINDVAVPFLQEKMYRQWLSPKEEQMKKNYNGVIAAAEGSLIGTLLGATRTDTEKYLSQVGQEAWRENASLLGRAAAGAGSMFLDLPVFGGIGALASVPAKAVGGQVFKQLAKNETKRLVARGVAESAAQRYANYAVRNGLKNRILLNLSTAPLQSGLTFGVFDAGKAALNMSLNGEWDWKELGKSAAGGALMGGALGATGAVGGGLTHGLTGATKAAAKVAEFGVENAVFTEGGRLIGKLHGQQPENGWLEDYVESGATLLMIKAPNIVKNVSRIKGDKEASEVFSFDKLEREQLGKYGNDLNAVLEDMLPRAEVSLTGKTKVGLKGDTKVSEEALTEQYVRVMSDTEVPLATKAKLMGIVEGKVMSVPRVVTATVEGDVVKTYDALGRLVEAKEFANGKMAEAAVEKMQPEMDKNSVSVLEELYVRARGYEADNATVMEWLAQNPDVKAEDIAKIVAKNNTGEKLTEVEQKILDSLRKARREGLNDVRYLNDVLAELEAMGIDAKDVKSGIEKPVNKRTEAENKAVNAYRNLLFREVEARVDVKGAMEREQMKKDAGDVNNAAENVRKSQEGAKLLADRIQESDRQVDETANDGMVYTTTNNNGEKIIITGGKVVLDNEGYIDVNQSEGLVALMPDGTKKPVRVDELREKVEVSNAEELKAVRRTEIKQEVSAEPIAESGEVAKNEVLTYEEDGETHSIEVLGDNGDGTSRITNDGQEEIIGNDLLESLRGTQEIVEAQKGGNVIEGVESVGETDTLPKEKQAPAPIPTEKRGKEERAAYHLVPIERTMEDLHDGTLEPDEIVGLIDARIKEAESDVKAVEKKKPVIGADKNAYVAAKQQWQADMEAAKAKLDYYNQLKAINAEATRSEMREAVETVKPRDVVEKTADEFVASVMPKITPESFKKETGLKNSEQKALVGVIAGEGNGGVTIEQAAEIVLENYEDELRGLGFNGDVQDVRDMIIDILSTGNPRSYAKKGLEMRQQADVELQKQELEGIAVGMNFKDTKEMIGYEEAVVPRIIQDYTGFDETEYFNNLAENIKYDTTREGESTRGSSELLQGEQPADNAGVADLGEPGQGGEVQGDVYSGGENAAPQGNQQVSGSEIPNNQNRDNVSPVEGVAEGEVRTESGEVKTENASSEADAPGQSGVQQNESGKMYLPEELAEAKEQLGELNATSAPEFAARLFSIKPWETLEEANAALKELLASYGETLNGQSLAVMPFLDKAQGLISEYNKSQEPRSVEEVLENGDKRITNYNSRGEVATVATERDGKVVSVDSYDEGVLFEHTEYDTNGVSTSVTRYDKQGNVIGTQVYVDGKAVTSETTEQPETGEVADAGPVNMETLQLNMSEEDFNALLNSGDKAAVSEYLDELDGALRIDENSPFAGQMALREEYRKAVELYGKENIPAEVMDDLNSRMQPYSDLSRAIFDRKYALQDKLREIEASEAQANEQAEKEAKAEHKQTVFGGFLADKTDLAASTAEKALSKKYNFDGKVMTVAEFVEDAVGRGDVKLSAVEEPKYKGASRAAWNRMDARQQEADAKRVKESGTKTVYTVNDHNFGKNAYDYAKFLQEKKAAESVAPKVEETAEVSKEVKPVKIEDVGEKIGGARKDVIRKYADKIKLDGKTFGTMFPKPEIDQLVEAGLPLDRVAAVKAMFDNAKREYERTKKRMGKDKALSASLFYAMYAKNVLNGETDNFDLKYNGWVFTDWGKEYMKANIALYRAVFEKLGAEYGKMDLAKYAITPLDAQHKKMLNLKALNESNARMQALRAKEKGEEPPVCKDGDLINFVGENHARPSDQFETLEEAVNAMVERIGKEVKPGAEALYKPEVYWKTDERGRADYSKTFVGVKVRGFGTVDLMEFKSSNEARQWLDEHGDDFQQMAAAKEVQVRAENKKPLPKYSIEYTLDRVNSQYAVVANFGRGKVHTLRTFDFPEDDARARMSVFKDEVMPFLNSQEAVQAANEYAEELQQKKSAPKNVVVEKNSRERVGVDWRNGQDATTEMFVDVEGKEPSVFGFRALEFGNYVSQKERQQYLNDIYDALMDMSEVLGVSPRALSLGGKLALAVGARGTSGASGHYEPYKNVINITKTKGAGVLAHEWLHALDRYFSNFDENALYPNGVRYATGKEYAENTRREIKDAFEKIMSAVRGGEYQKRSARLGDYWASDKELAARALQDYMMRKLDERGQKNDFLSNHLAPEDWAGDMNNYPFPLGAEADRIAEAFDNFFATVEEKNEDGQTVLFQQGMIELDRENPAFERATENVRKKLEATGVKVNVLTKEEAESELARLEELADMQKRTAPETASVQDEHQPTVVSSADGAKVLKDLDNAIKEYENKSSYPKTLLGDVAKVLNAKKHGSNSQYATFEAVNGKVFTIRLANHNAKISTFDNHDESEGISIVVTAQDNNGVTNDGNAHLVEFFYDAIKLRKADGKPLVEILKSIKQALYSGEYKDNTGLAVREEVNIPEFMRVLNENAKKTGLIGTHSLTEEKLRKAIKMGGLANPSTAIFEMGEEMPGEYGEITFVMPSSMVDKKTGRNTGAFAGDAWTPTYPQVERQMSKRGGYRAREDVQSVPKEMQKEVRMGLDSWLDGREGAGLAYMFLQEEGMAPELSRVAQKYSDEVRNRVNEIAQGEPFYRLSPEQKQQVVDLFIGQYYNGDVDNYNGYLKEKVAMLQEKLADENVKSFIKKNIQQYIDGVNEYGYEYESVSDFLNKVQRDINHSGGVNDMATAQEAARIIREQGLEKEFQEWKEELVDRYEIKEVIFKGFTPTGNRKYVPHTLENVSKDMKEQGRNGAVGLNASFSKFAAGLLKPLNSLDAIRKRKGNLRPTHADTEAFKNKWSEVYYDLAEKLQPDAKGYEDYGLDRVAEAATKKDPKSFIKSEYGIELSEADEKALKDMIWAIQNEYPVMYFETKFERPVYLDEFAGVALPENVGKDIVEALNNAGVKIETYEPGDEKARMDAVKRLAAADNRIEFLRTPDGVTYGWAVNGEIYLTPEGLNPNTPIHEYTHLWAAALQKSNPKLWGEVVEAMKLSPAWNEVMADENYTDIHGDDNRVASEVLSRLSGNEGYRRYMEQAEAEIAAENNLGEKVRKKGALNFFKRIWNKFRNWLQSVFKSGKVKAGDGTEAKAEPWDVFVNKSLKDFDEGVNPDAKDSPLDWMFIGKKGAENLDKAEEATTRLDNLNVAREMESGGKDAKAIKLATGWERGADGKWRYETEDAKVNRGAELFSLETYKSYPIAGSIEIGRVDENSTIKLTSLVKDDELFKAYPEMEEYYVSFEKMPAETKGSHSFEEKMIRINKDNIHSLGSTLVHEIQHAVQSIEGFAKGGSTNTRAYLYSKVPAGIPSAVDIVGKMENPTIEKVKGVLKDGDLYMYQAADLREMLNDIEQGKYTLMDVANYAKSRGVTANETYRRLAGEVESRNVQERMGMTPEQRRNKLAEETEDVRREDQIFLEKNLGESASEAAEEDIPVESVQTQPMTFAEKITNSVLEASAKNKENLALRSDALRMFGRDVANILKLMGKQREYDKSTVDQLVKLAKMYFKDAQLLGGLTPYQVGRVMTRLNNAVGKRDITDDANELVNILVDAHNKELEKMLEKQAKTKAKKVNASGVEVIGKLDKEGQLLLEEYNAGKELDLESIDEKIIDLQNEAAEGKAEEAAARIRGLELARQYREEILKKRDEIKGLEQELKSAEQDAKDGAMDRAAYKEFRRATERAILESKLEMVDAYHGLIHGLGGDISSSAKRAKLFQQQQIDHVKEIQHNANSDLLGHPAEAQGETPDKWNSSVPRFFMVAMPTFQTMLKFFGEKAADGRGYLYERFIPQHTQAGHNEYVGKTEAREKMRKKLTEIFGKKTSIEKFMDMSRKDGAVLEYQEGGEKKTIDLTRGQVLYLYMINKMADGQMKLSRMGITDADVQKMAKELPEEMVRFADWVQEEFLTELREKYNKVHERMFGAPMAAIESYFPIKINKRSRGEKIEPGMNAEDKPSTVTGSVIKRTKNAVAIDLSADAMQVLLGHIDDMENWAAWAEFRRDVKSLLNYRHFQNQVKGMESIRFGSGEKLWKNFVDVANIAAGSFKPSNSAADKAVRNIAKGVVSSKIAFRLYTAAKQILSAPAFWTEVDFGKMVHAYTHQREAWKWAKENLPGFTKRWEGRAAGNEILLESDKDWKVWKNRFVEDASKWGMTPNAAIDALTVAVGAKAVYETKYEMFKKAGYSEERAKEKALNRAAEAYNESQQSSEGAYLSPLQAEATWLSSVLTAYRNSSFGYNRKLATAVANLKKKTKKGFKQESIEYMIKQLMRDGLNEEQAKKFAKSTYRRSVARDAADVAQFGFLLNFVWALGGGAIYLFGGDDEEEKKEILLEAALDGAMSSIAQLPAGEAMTRALKSAIAGEGIMFDLPKAVAAQDLETIVQLLETDVVRAANETLNMVVAMGIRVNPQTFTDVYVALADVEDWTDPRELAMAALRVMNSPNSQLDLLTADEAMENYGANIEDVMKEYAEYQKSKRAPLSGWLYSDESEQKAIERYEKRFKKILDERFESIVENTDEYDMWYENSDPQMKAKLAKLRQKFQEGDKETTMEKLDSIDVTKKVLFGSGYDEVNTVYYELSTAEDEDMAMMIDTKLKELQPMMDEYKKLRGDERKAYREENLEQIQFYNRLNAHKNNVNNLKGAMKKKPEEAQEKMDVIRKLRTEAVELINNYNE